MDANKWGLFFLGVQLFMGHSRVYASEKTARRRIMEEIKEHIWKPYPPQQYYFTKASEYEKELAKYEVDKKKYDKDYLKSKTAAEKIMKDLETTGMLEIRKIGDRSPKFPFNKPNIEKEQAEKFSKMLDASDKEMVDLAISILEKI